MPVNGNLLQWRRNIYGHSGLVWTKFWENYIGYAIGDDKFYMDILISPDQVKKHSYATDNMPSSFYQLSLSQSLLLGKQCMPVQHVYCYQILNLKVFKKCHKCHFCLELYIGLGKFWWIIQKTVWLEMLHLSLKCPIVCALANSKSWYTLTLINMCINQR